MGFTERFNNFKTRVNDTFFCVKNFTNKKIFIVITVCCVGLTIGSILLGAPIIVSLGFFITTSLFLLLPFLVKLFSNEEF